jgi:hypothetical protein
MKMAKPSKSKETRVIPPSDTARLMYYLKSVKILIQDAEIADWAINYDNYRITDEQTVELYKLTKKYGFEFMMQNNYFIKVNELPNSNYMISKKNLFVDVGNEESYHSFPFQTYNLIKKSEKPKVMLFIQKWKEENFDLPLTSIKAKIPATGDVATA